MAEVNTKSIIINVGDESYKLANVGFEDICTEIGMTPQVFQELLSRDFYVPQMSKAPTSSDTSYTDPSDGKATHFKVGQCCVYPDNASSDGWGFSIAKHIETDTDGTPTSIVWQKFLNEAPMGKETVYGLFGLPVE